MSRALIFEKLGRPENVLRVKKIPLQMTDSTVRLKVLAAPINPSDINIIEGTYPLQPNWKEFGAVGGQEGVAQVLECGSKVTNVKVGDWVVPIQQSFNTWQTHAIADAQSILKLPDTTGISPIIAATISVNPPTAYRMLKDFGSLVPGDVVIQNSSNSGVGQSVIQLCRAWGFKSVNVIRPREDSSKLMEELYQMGADLVITEDEVRKTETQTLIERLGRPKLALNGVGGKSATNMARLLQ
jgi:trans-2-enoyl-CoA reductase